MSIFSEYALNEKIIEYLNDDIKNPLLRKVIEEEFIYSSTLDTILKIYLSKLSSDVDYSNKLNSLNTLIKNVSKDNYNHLRDQLTSGFINLDHDQHIFLIVNMNNNMKSIFEVMNENNNTSNILKTILTGLSIGINDLYITKCIDSCKIINSKISDLIVSEYINNNGIDIVMNDTLLSYFLKYLHESIVYENIKSCEILHPLIDVKLISIMTNLNSLSLDNMEFAFEIYKLGKIIIDGSLKFQSMQIYMYSLNILNFSNEQLEYIARSIHTCIINNNIPQAQTIQAIIYFIDSNLVTKYMKFYNKYLKLRIKKTVNTVLLSNEYELWNIANDYKNIMSKSIFSEYIQIINNIKYSIIVNNEMNQIKIKNSNIQMNKINVTIENEIDDNINFIHHPTINEYIEGLNKYINIRTSLQKIEHSINKSNITFKTKMGSIKCSLVIGSILLYLQDSPSSITELMEKTKLNEVELRNRIDILYLNNIVVLNDNGVIYKYIEPFGDVDCSIINMKVKEEQKDMVISKFTDIITTVDSRIMKEIKLNNMNVMELERRVQEFMGDSYVRNIFYQRLDSLKNKFLIKENDSIIEYVL
jgi:hypothetical protein